MQAWLATRHAAGLLTLDASQLSRVELVLARRTRTGCPVIRHRSLPPLGRTPSGSRRSCRAIRMLQAYCNPVLAASCRLGTLHMSAVLAFCLLRTAAAAALFFDTFVTPLLDRIPSGFCCCFRCRVSCEAWFNGVKKISASHYTQLHLQGMSFQCKFTYLADVILKYQVRSTACSRVDRGCRPLPCLACSMGRGI